MPEIKLSKDTRWECVRCGECCRGIIISKKSNLSIVVDGKPVCRFLKNNQCTDYPDRPFICRLYPFVIDIEKIIGIDGVARPQNAFSFENLKIHDECPGVGQGKPIRSNGNLLRKIERLSIEFSERFKEVHEKKLGIDELM